MSCLVHRPSNSAYYIEDWLISYPKEEFSLNVLNNSPGEEAISSIMTKLEMAKHVNLQMGKKLPFINLKVGANLIEMALRTCNL